MPEARFQLDNKDVADAARIHAGILKPTYWIWLAIVILLPAVSNGTFDWRRLLIRAGVFIPVLLLGLYIRRRTRRRGGWLTGYWATLFFRRDKIAAAPQVITWDERGLEATTPFGTTLTPWGDFKRWAERDGLHLLYTSRRRYRILPRRAFLGLAEMDELERYLTAAGARRVGPARLRQVPRRDAIVEAF